jgi:hypothetical protein
MPTRIVLQPRPSLNQLMVNLGSGDDVARVIGVEATGNLVALLGDGRDYLRMERVSSLGQFRAQDTSGDDTVLLNNVQASGPSSISLALGNDEVAIGGANTSFGSDLSILTGGGSDTVRFLPGHALIRRNLLVDTSAPTGDGNDQIFVYYSNLDIATLEVVGNTTVRTGDGADQLIGGLSGYGSGPGPAAWLNRLDISMGAGDDTISGDRVETGLAIVRLDEGNDKVLGCGDVLPDPGSILDGGPGHDVYPCPSPPDEFSVINFEVVG